MTTTITTPLHRPIDRRGTSPLTLARAVRAEWVKLRSLPSSFILVASSLAAMVLIGMLGAGGILMSQRDGALVTDASIFAMPTGGLPFGQLLLGALAVLLISSEYGTGAIRSTMTAVPTRTPALLAKAIIGAALGAVIGVVSAFGTYAAIQPILDEENFGFGLDEPGVLGSLFATGAYLALIAVLALAIGTLMRNSAGAIVTLIGLLFVLPMVFSMIPGEWSANILKYLPSEAGNRLMAVETTADQLTQAQGALVLLVWVVVPFVAALFTLRKRDV
jgi:ABC-type transport system involved in multi-copper enzyme maturation permease subunit